MNKNDSGFSLRWAKKIIAVNLLGGKCVDCKENNLFVLEFHHKDKVEKEESVAVLLKGRWSNIKKEIQKCSLLCANCHRVRHIEDPIDSRRRLLKVKLLEYKNIFSCQRCGFSDPSFSTLSFHHRDPDKKMHNINEITWKHKDVVNEVRKELDKCDILCFNCHCIEHTQIERFVKLKKTINRKVNNHKERPVLDHETIFALYSKGMSQSSIARELGCAKSSISYIIKKEIK